MRTKKEVIEERWGVSTALEASSLFLEQLWAFYPTMPVSLKLPYEAPNHPDLPTLQEIATAMNTKSTRLSREGYGKPVCRVGDFVVKVGVPNEPMIVHEAENLIYLQEHTKVRAPRLHAAFQGPCWIDPSYEVIYLVMDFIEGETLTSETWKALSGEEKEKIGASLSEQFRLLRSVPSEGYYGRVGHQPWHPLSPMYRYSPWNQLGPYQTYDECISAISDCFVIQKATSALCPDFNEREIGAFNKFKPVLSQCNGQTPTLTHNDVKIRNFRVNRIQGADGTLDFEVTLIDWEDMGWQPAWVQGAQVHLFVGMMDIEDDAILIGMLAPLLIEPYPEQKKLFGELWNELRYYIH